MATNVAEVQDKLLPTTVEIAMQARNFQKNAQELEKAARSRSFWAGSPKCLIMVGGGGGGCVILYYVLMAILK